MMLRVLGAVAAHESASKSRRIKRKNDERAAAGLPNVSGNRPFGYEADWITVVEDEAAALREVVERFLAGESQRSLCSWLDDQGIKTAAGGTWRTSQLATTLKNPRYAGLLVHRGEIQEVTADLAESFGLDRPHGALVAQVQEDSPASRAGLQASDVILTFNGMAVENSGDLPRMVGLVKPGTRIPVEVWRKGKVQQLSVVLGELPAEKQVRGG